MKIAIAAVLFDDTTRIGSQRSRALSSELAKLGNQVTVFTQDFEGGAPPPQDVDVVRLGGYSADLWPRTGFRGLIRKGLVGLVVAPTTVPVAVLKLSKARGGPNEANQARLEELNQRRFSSVLRLDQLLSTHMWIKAARTQLGCLPYEQTQFDVVFSTFDPLGRLLKENGVARSWVNDFRDPAYSPVYLPAIGAYLRTYQNRLLKDADWVTAVSGGVRTALERGRIGRQSRGKISVIPNGFREQNDLPPAPTGIGPLKVGYTGTLYSRQEGELRLLLSLLTSVAKSTGTTVEFHYAGRNGSKCSRLAAEVGAEDILVLHGSLNHQDSLRLQSAMDALVVLAWNTEEEQGVLSGKFLEYLGSERPIIAMVAGDKPGSELCAAIATMRIGVCFEAAVSEDGPNLEAWLTKAALDRSVGLSVEFAPNQEEVQKYNYANIASRLEKILSRVAVKSPWG